MQERNARGSSAPSPKHLALFFALGLLALGVGACGVGFGEGGEPGLITPAQEQNPALQGRIEGKVEVDSAFLNDFVESLGPTGPTTAGSLLVAARSLNGRLRVGILGSRRLQSKDLGADGSFSFEGVPEGSYGLSLSADGRVLGRFPLQLTRRSTLRVTARFLGWDRRSSPARLAVAWELQVRGKDLEWQRRYLPGGAQITLLPDGTVERSSAGGRVRSRATDGTIRWRRDRDNDFVPDEEERGRGRSSDGKGADDPLCPLLVDLRLANLTRPKAGAAVIPGDLLLFQAKTASQPGEPVVAVGADLLPAEGTTRHFELADDGSEMDLVERWPGVQISGDERAGDEDFAYILPIDRGTRELLYSSQLVFRARSRSGAQSHPRFLFLHGEADGGQNRGTFTGPLVSGLRELAFQVRREGDRVWVLGSFEARSDVASQLTASLLGPDVRRLFVAGSGGSGGWVAFRTTPALLSTGGSLLAVVGTRSGQIYYAGLPVHDLDAVGRETIIRLQSLQRRGG